LCCLTGGLLEEFLGLGVPVSVLEIECGFEAGTYIVEADD